MSSNELADAFDEIDAEELTPMEEDCPCGSHEPFEQCCYLAAHSEEIEEALLLLLARHKATSHLSLLEMWQMAESVIELIWLTDRLPMHGDPEPEGDEVTQAELYAVAGRFPPDCRYCDGSQHFYSEPELGPCVCAAEEINIVELIG